MRLLLATVLATSNAEWNAAKKCWDGPTSRYNGDISKTESGKTCQKWNLDEPHKPKHRPKEVAEDGQIHNHCRNPDLDLAGPWCYTTDPETRWEYCNITACADDDSYIIWTNFDAEHQSSHLVQVHANPEVVRDQTDQSGSFNVHAITMTNTNESLTEYWALAADYKHKQIYWTDYRAEHIGRFDWEKNKTENNLYKGMAHGIENLAVDWLTGNLYWTDSDYKWIMVANKDFTQYSQVYKATDDPDGPPYGLAIHSTKKYLFWSTYKIMGATIKRADLTADNDNAKTHKKIVQFPVVHDVTGLTVDYTDDRIYWTDFLGSAAVVSSSDFEGNHIINHFHRTGSVFWGVACYDHYLYVSDIYPKFMQDGKKYMLWVVTKLYIDPEYDMENASANDYVPQEMLSHPANEQKSFRYSITGRPRGVSVFSKYAAPAENVVNPCEEDAQGNYGGCDHICIPKAAVSSGQKERVCRCGIGYELKKAQQQGCYANIQKPPYLVFADVDHALIFQMSLQNEVASESNDLTKKSYNVIPSKNADTIHALCIDPVKLKIYYADKASKTILARQIHLSDSEAEEDMEERIYSNIIAQSCVVDNEGSNIFFVEGETRNIQVISTEQGGGILTVFDSDKNAEGELTPNIQNIAIDTRRKKIYWTDPTLTEGKGKIACSNYDGSDYKVVIHELHWPQGIKIYNAEETGKDILFFTEALTGVIYEINLSALDKVSANSPWKFPAATGGTLPDGVVLFNITEANPRLKQFHMDIALHGDYLYFTDLKNNAIERFNHVAAKEDAKNLKIETYGPAEFYSLIYMYAVSEDSLTQMSYAKTDCSGCFGTNKLCIARLDEDAKGKAVCKCSDGYELDASSQNCLEVEASAEYVVENCPKDRQQSSSMCQNGVTLNVKQLFGLEDPKIQRNGHNLSLEDFDIKKSYFNIKTGAIPKTITDGDNQIVLPGGTNIIRYEFTDKQFNEKVSCQWTVQAIVHQCKALDEASLDGNLQVHSCDCSSGESNPRNCEMDAMQPLGMQVSVECKNGQYIQPMVEKQRIQDKYPQMNFTSATMSLDGKVATMASIFPTKYLVYRCEPIADEFVVLVLKQIEGTGKTIEFECVDQKPAIPMPRPTSGSSVPDRTDESKANVIPAAPESDKTKGKSKGGVVAVVLIVIVIILVVAAVMYKKMRTDYDGGFSFKGIFSRAPDPTAEMEVPKTSTPYSAM